MNIIKWDGKPITRPGIYDGVPIETYHHDHTLFGGEPHISSGGLRMIASPDGSLEHFYENYPGNPDRVEPEPKKQFDIGKARHMLYLGEPGFREQYVIRPEKAPDGRAWHHANKGCIEWMEAAADDNKIVITQEDFDDIKAAALKLAAHPTIKSGILNGLVEKSIFWKRDVALEDGQVITIWLKARPDVLPVDSAMIVDYKGTADAAPTPVRRSITDFGYHQQLALGHEGIWATTGRVMEEHVLVFQEWKRPYSINVKPLMGAAIHAGHMLNWYAMRLFAKAIAEDVWPGYADDEVPADIMDWRRKQIELEQKAGMLFDPPELEPMLAPQLALPAPAYEADEVI